MVIEKLKTKLEESEARYRRLFETARDGILILNSDTGQITDVNPFLEQLLGYSKKEFLGKKLWEVVAFRNIKTSQKYFKDLQDTGYVRYENLPLEANDGRQIEVEFISNVYMASETKVIQCNIRDISERRRQEAGVETERLLGEEKKRTEFIADLTHELRTPLAIIKGNIDLVLLSKSKNQKSGHGTLRAIDGEVKHLSNMLTDLTLLTMKEVSPERKIDYRQVNIQEIIYKAIKRCKTFAEKKNISIRFKGTKDVVTLGDKIYLEKLFVNLIKNAITYGSKNGFVLISSSKSKSHIEIVISDNGIGITTEDLPHIFDRFYRADKSRHSHSEGRTGLGLAISKWVVEAHDGTINVTSIFGKGTAFAISIPIKEAE